MPEDRPEQQVRDFRIVEAPETCRISRDPRYGRSWVYVRAAVEPGKPLTVVTEFAVKVSVADAEALGRFADSTLLTFNIVHLMYPDWRASPYFTLGAGTIRTEPKATLVATVDREESLGQVGVGVRTYLTRSFVFRAEYKAHVVFTSRDDNEEVREWKAGFSFFF